MDLKINLFKNLQPNAVPWHSSGWLCKLKVLSTLLILSFITTQAPAQSGSGPSQGKNGGKPTSKGVCDISVLSPVLWENGNAGSGDAHLLEGYHLPYRYIMTGLTAGITYTLQIGFDAKDNGKFALDYVGSYRNYAPHQVFSTGPDPDCANHTTIPYDGELVQPWDGTSLNGSVLAQATIPEPTYLPSFVRGTTGSWGSSSTALRQFTVFGASSIVPNSLAYFLDDGSAEGGALPTLTNATTGSTRMGLKLKFVAAGSTAVAAWGGHIASRFDYGNTGTGASDINGSPYHTRLIVFANATRTQQYAGGSADRSLKAAAVYIPPSCSLTGPTRACPNTTSLTYTATLDAADFGAVSYTWEIINDATTPANANIQGSLSGTTSLSSLTVNIVPASSAGFTPGGKFTLHLRVSRAGLVDDCYINSHTAPGDVVTIDDVRISASANPINIDIYSATHNSVLSAEARLFPAAVNNSLFSFVWSIDAGSPYTLVNTADPTVKNVQLAAVPNTVLGTLTGFNTASATFTPNISAFPGTFTFRVTATELAAPGCANSTTVAVTVGGSLSCPVIAGDNPVCQGSTHTYSYSGGQIPSGSTTQWLLDGSPISGATGTSVQITAGATNFTVALRIQPANPDLSPLDCPYPVTVNPTPSCSITGNDPVCGGSTNTYTSTVLPAGGTVTHSWSISGDGTINGATNGASVSVTAGTSGSFTLTDNISREGCTSSCTKTVTVNAVPSCSITGNDPVCGGSTNTYTSTVLPAGGTVTHSWSISGDGTINGATNGASVSVTAGTSGSYTLTDNISRDGCTSSCSQTYTVVQCVFPHLFPTQTTCCNYLGGNTSSFQLQRACITLSGNKVSNATPGVFFYYGSYTATASGSTIIRVGQSRTGTGLAPFLPQGTGGGNANVLVDNCQSVPGTVTISAPTTGQSAGDVTFTFTAVAGHTYVILVKYDMKSIVGKNAPAPSGSNSTPWSIYSFQMYLNSSSSALQGSLGQLPLFASGTYSGVQYTCNPNEQSPSGTCPSTTVLTRKAPTSGPVQVNDLQVAAYPNPYNSSISFQFVSPAAGKASLEVYDLLGRKLAVIYQGNVDAGKQRTVNYKVPSTQHVPMIYKLRVGSKTTFGKLLPGNNE
jgi:hypothetical protein